MAILHRLCVFTQGSLRFRFSSLGYWYSGKSPPPLLLDFGSTAHQRRGAACEIQVSWSNVRCFDPAAWRQLVRLSAATAGYGAASLVYGVLEGRQADVSLTRQIVNLVRAARLDYFGFNHVCEEVRKELGLRRPRRGQQLPKILPESALRKLYETISRGGNLQHEIMLKLLLFTGVRVSELCNMRMDDVDLDAGKIFIESGKGDKDRYVLMPDQFRLVLKAYMAGVPKNKYLFESQRRTKFSRRRIQELVGDYGRDAGLEGVHPHLLRHQLLSFLTEQGLPDAKIQLISGHSSKKALEIYQHISLGSVQPGYQDAIKRLDI